MYITWPDNVTLTQAPLSQDWDCFTALSTLHSTLYTLLYCTVLYTLLYCTLYSTLLNCTLYFTLLYSTPYSTVLYCTLYCTLLSTLYSAPAYKTTEGNYKKICLNILFRHSVCIYR